MIRGTIIRVFDERGVVLDVGTEHGVTKGLKFGIYTPEEEILAPETGERLGGYRTQKAEVIAQDVFPKFTVARPPAKRVRVRNDPRPSAPEALSSLLGVGSWKYVPGDLEVEPGEVEPLPTGRTVRVGDLVEAEEPPVEEGRGELPASPSEEAAPSNPGSGAAG